MKNLLVTVGAFFTGALAGATLITLATDKGPVVYEDEEIYVRASKTVSGGSSYAKVFYKKPVEE